MHKKSSASTGLCLLLIFSLISCGSPPKEQQDIAAKEFTEAETGLKNQIEQVIYAIPSPSEIPFLLESTGAEFNHSLINSNDKADHYATQNSKAALNLGVYSADIGYLVSYDKVQEAASYMEAAKKLADKLGISGVFDPELIRRFENNLSEKDSLSYLLNETISKTEHYLRDDNRNKLAALIITGSFIEGLYISTALIETYPKDILRNDSRNQILTPLIRVVLEQEKSLKDLIGMLDSFEPSEPVETLLKELRELEVHYSNLDIEAQIRENRADLILSEATLSDITKKVAEIRKSEII